MLVKNTQEGPRGIHAVDGLVILEPGQTRELAVTATEAKIAEGTGWFDLSGAPVDADDQSQGGGSGSDGGDEREALKAEATSLGIEFPRNIPTPKLKELVEAKRAEIAGQGGGSGQ